MISLYRIDDRIIHGQTMIKLLPQYPCDGIIIVDNNIVQNKPLFRIYKQVVPDTIKVFCFSVDQATKKLSEAQLSQKKYIIIFKNVKTVKDLFDHGYQITDEISVGTASKKSDAHYIVDGFALNNEEIDVFDYLDNNGYHFSIIPMGGARRTISWKDVKEKAQEAKS